MSDTDLSASPTYSAEPIPLRLKPSRQFPFLARHPWVHAHALAEEGRDLACGQVVDLLDHDGNWVARGLCNPASRLRVRLYAYDQATQIDGDLWRSRLDAAIARRQLSSPAGPDEAERLCFSESDLLSGVIIDRYADCVGVQFTAGGLLRWKDEILDHLKSRLADSPSGCRAIMVRVDPKTAKHEGIEAIEHWHNETGIDEPVNYRQNGLDLAVDLRSGQKTGGYLDQRLNHLATAGYLAGRRVLDVCCYHGGFGLVAAKHGAKSVLGLDSSQAALDAAQVAADKNQIENIQFQNGDCFDELKAMGERGDQFDAVILDPPRFAGSRHQVDNAIRAYRRLNASAIDLLPPGGILATCSCSGRVSRSDFLNMLLDVGRRRRRDIVMFENRGPAPDHPVAISCPESDYLKCVIAQVW
ncbi:Ribosomal RNA large subunit methyltransferase I [Rubripirellula lacrimiformis]|uniref:Ribosomal RNA large subunit methyltransferase I n=1 Tax=Rubripirellula lacrimiformis TaxID=1930273 RepID=A0A517N714_9BACT|nr:class I SAM-dependent rRNA methyltransferase [Rubripirellula lacrimiformis]QDT02933.1 Ribosomal RNA large subunit methyltransferase I [Rubripirellula lacrimiformis]